MIKLFANLHFKGTDLTDDSASLLEFTAVDSDDGAGKVFVEVIVDMADKFLFTVVDAGVTIATFDVPGWLHRTNPVTKHSKESSAVT